MFWCIVVECVCICVSHRFDSGFLSLTHTAFSFSCVFSLFVYVFVCPLVSVCTCLFERELHPHALLFDPLLPLFASIAGPLFLARAHALTLSHTCSSCVSAKSPPPSQKNNPAHSLPPLRSYFFKSVLMCAHCVPACAISSS
mmetsp:Transcript_38513/g.62091  ORF Transcript_38513/g.62091 Transcript_38513/m.62091 type:complete len:142 (+) Transcript_38513:53-478(+)